MGDSRDERKAENEVLFRTVNERIRELGDSFGLHGNGFDRLDCVCECSRTECFERIPVPYADYEAARSDPQRFLLAPGHDDPSIETVVGRGDGYEVVEKIVAREVSEENDPRD